mgnify:CR=1 FL=1
MNLKSMTLPELTAVTAVGCETPEQMEKPEETFELTLRVVE